MSDTYDILELELRQLPGVVGVGLHHDGEGLVVRLRLATGADAEPVRRRAELLAHAHAEHPRVELVTDPDRRSVPTRERLRLLAVVRVPASDELEVHLSSGSRRTVGRHRGAGVLAGAVEATLESVAALGSGPRFRHVWSLELETSGDRSVTVAVALAEEGSTRHRHGIAAAPSGEEAAARATLHALNRALEGPPTGPEVEASVPTRPDGEPR